MKHYVKLLSIFSIAFIAVGCSIAKPMTKRIDNAASLVGKVDEFQYYVSRNIVLTKVQETDFEGGVHTKGNLKVTKNRDVIQITSSTCGALLKTTVYSDGTKAYNIAFEADNDNVLTFKQNQLGNEKRIYLQYDNVKSHEVLYGGEWYVVEWAGVEGLGKSKVRAKSDNFFAKIAGFFRGVPCDNKDDPYLLVKMNVKIDEKEAYRKASGRKVSRK